MTDGEAANVKESLIKEVIFIAKEKDAHAVRKIRHCLQKDYLSASDNYLSTYDNYLKASDNYPSRSDNLCRPCPVFFHTGQKFFPKEPVILSVPCFLPDTLTFPKRESTDAVRGGLLALFLYIYVDNKTVEPKLRRKMKKLIVFAFMALIAMGGTTVSAQQNDVKNKSEQKARRDAERARQKAEAHAFDSLMHASAYAALQGQQFVLEADKVIFKRGESAYVNSTTNFVLMNDDKSTVQVALNTPVAGPNGIGGVTVDGNVSDFEIKTGKKGDVSCRFSVQGVGISALIFLHMDADSNDATVTITPNFNSNKLTLNGKIVPLEQSRIFKGRSW